MTLKIWRGNYTVKFRFEQGLFKKHFEEQDVAFDDDKFVIAETEEEAIEKFEERKCREENDVPYFLIMDYNIPTKRTIVSKIVSAYQTRATFDYLKEKTFADEFLAYCKQELYGSHPEDFIEDFLKIY
jgi:hypothetical protein